jgi:hypothetical protein
MPEAPPGWHFCASRGDALRKLAVAGCPSCGRGREAQGISGEPFDCDEEAAAAPAPVRESIHDAEVPPTARWGRGVPRRARTAVALRLAALLRARKLREADGLVRGLCGGAKCCIIDASAAEELKPQSAGHVEDVASVTAGEPPHKAKAQHAHRIILGMPDRAPGPDGARAGFLRSLCCAELCEALADVANAVLAGTLTLCGCDSGRVTQFRQESGRVRTLVIRGSIYKVVCAMILRAGVATALADHTRPSTQCAMRLGAAHAVVERWLQEGSTVVLADLRQAYYNARRQQIVDCLPADLRPLAAVLMRDAHTDSLGMVAAGLLPGDALAAGLFAVSTTGPLSRLPQDKVVAMVDDLAFLRDIEDDVSREFREAGQVWLPQKRREVTSGEGCWWIGLPIGEHARGAICAQLRDRLDAQLEKAGTRLGATWRALYAANARLNFVAGHKSCAPDEFDALDAMYRDQAARLLGGDALAQQHADMLLKPIRLGGIGTVRADVLAPVARELGAARCDRWVTEFRPDWGVTSTRFNGAIPHRQLAETLFDQHACDPAEMQEREFPRTQQARELHKIFSCDNRPSGIVSALTVAWRVCVASGIAMSRDDAIVAGLRMPLGLPLTKDGRGEQESTRPCGCGQELAASVAHMQTCCHANASVAAMSANRRAHDSVRDAVWSTLRDAGWAPTLEPGGLYAGSQGRPDVFVTDVASGKEHLAIDVSITSKSVTHTERAKSTKYAPRRSTVGQQRLVPLVASWRGELGPQSRDGLQLLAKRCSEATGVHAGTLLTVLGHAVAEHTFRGIAAKARLWAAHAEVPLVPKLEAEVIGCKWRQDPDAAVALELFARAHARDEAAAAAANAHAEDGQEADSEDSQRSSPELSHEVLVSPSQTPTGVVSPQAAQFGATQDILESTQ